MVLPLNIRADLVTLYNEPHRVYHNLSHVYDCLNVFQHTVNKPGFAESIAVQNAIWFHDAVYHPLSSMNEDDSYELFKSTKPWEWASAYEVTLMCIYLSAQHSNHEKEALCGNNEAVKLFMDIDCAVLGRSYNGYADYVDAVRKEYSMVSDFDFYQGRKKFLTDMLALSSIYLTYEFKTKLEAKARENLTHELKRVNYILEGY